MMLVIRGYLVALYAEDEWVLAVLVSTELIPTFQGGIFDVISR